MENKKTENGVVEKTKGDSYFNKIKKYLAVAGFGSLSNDEILVFGEKCRACGLNPFAGDIWPVPYNNGNGLRSVAAITSYLVYLARAQGNRFYRYTKSYSGEEGTLNRRIKLTVYDINGNEMCWQELVAEKIGARNRQGTDLNAMWKKDLDFMLEKCALKRAANFVCPKECKGLPYIAEEQHLIPGMKANAEVDKCAEKNTNIKVSV